MADIFGTNGNDVINGAADDDFISGGPQGGDPALEIGDDEINGGGGNDTILGHGGNDVLIGGAGTDSLFGNEGEDVFVVEYWEDLPAGEIYDGGTGTDTILVSVSNYQGFDFAPLTLSSIEALRFNTSAGTRSFFSGDQIGTGLSSTLAVYGDSQENHLHLRTGISGVIDISGWTFTNWQSGVDTISLDGSTGADTIIGSSQDDLISGGAGLDGMYGGGGNDRFLIGAFDQVEAGETFDGGMGTDTLYISGGVGNFTAASLISIEGLAFDAPYPTWGTFTSDQLGGAGLSATLAISGDPVRGSTITVNMVTDAVDLSGWTFTDWTVPPFAFNRIFINGSAASDTILGSSQRDIIQGSAGSDTMSAGDGDDIFTLNTSDVASGETIDGGSGTDALQVSGSIDFRQAAVASIEALHFGYDNNNPIKITFSSSQIGVGLSEDASISGNPGGNAIDIWMDVPGTLDLSGWTFSNWQSDASIYMGGSLADDTLIGSSQADTIQGNFGNDILIGGAGDDHLMGQYDTDELTGGAGEDIYGGSVTDWNGDRITDYEYSEIIRVLNGSLSQDSYQLRQTAVDTFVDIDANGDGNYESSIVLSGQVNGFLTVMEGAPLEANLVITQNSGPVITSNGGRSTAAISLAENTTAVTTVAATNPNPGNLTYSIIGGFDANLFIIDSSTGALAFATAPDFENPDLNGGFYDQSYSLQVQVADGHGELDTQTIMVTATNVNDNAPAFTSGTAASFAEKGAGVAYDAEAYDPDNLGSLNFSITGADAALFNINTLTGVVTFKAAPNFDSPLDADGNNVYDVVVTASDGTLSTNRNVAIAVTDANEPREMVIDSNGLMDFRTFGHLWGLPLEYNGQAGAGWSSFVGGYGISFSGTMDVQTDANGTAVSFSASLDGSFTMFKLGPIGEHLTVATGTMPPFYYESTFSGGDFAQADGNGGWHLGIHGSPNAPLPPLGPFGQFVADLDRIVLNGSDGIEDFDATYMETNTLMHGGDGDDYLFGAFRHTNEMHGGGGDDTLWGQGVNDSLDGGAGNDFVFDADNAGDGTIQDGGPQTAYNHDTLIGGDGDDQVLSTGGGDLLDGGAGNDFLQAAPDREDDDILIGGAGDDTINGGMGIDTAVFSGLRSQYFVTAVDQGGPVPSYLVSGPDGSDTLSGIEFLTFDDGTFAPVDLLNEAPTITSDGGDATAAVSITENTTAVTTVVATDSNAGDTLAYSKVGGADADLFTIDASTGVLAFISAPDFEASADAGANNVYEVQVQVADGNGGSDTQTISVTVTDEANVINGTPQADNLTGTANEDIITGFADNDVLSGLAGDDVVNAGQGDDNLDGGDGDDTLNGGQDADTLVGGAGNDTMNGGQDADTFIGGAGNDTMDGGAGPDTLDYGSEGGAHGVVVNLLGDGGIQGGLPSDTATDTFGDTDSIARIPNVIGTQYADEIYGGNHDNKLSGEGGDDILKGGELNDTLDGGTGTDTAIYGGNLSDYQIVQDPNGSLTIADLRGASPDGTDTVTNVELFDFADGQKTLAEILLPNSEPAITSDGGGENAAISLSENIAAVTIVTAADPDAGDTLTYSILDGFDANLFAIDSQTGALSFLSAADFENPDPNGGIPDQLYSVQVQVADGNGGFDTQTIAISVTNQNDNAPVFSSGAAANFAENATGTVYDANAGDADNLGALTYSLSGADSVLFDIDASTGVVTFKNAPDFETPLDQGANNVYDITVTASDGTLSTDQAVAITVTDVVEVSVINGTSGADTLNGTAGTDTINGLGSDDILNGLGGADILNGGAGSDTMNGGAGVDAMRGGAGNDVYVVDDVGDTVDESVGGSGGTDTVQSTISFSLADPVVLGAVENLSLTGSGAINATGNALANILTGNDGANILDGGAGADTMRGGAGDDTYVVERTSDTVDESVAGSGGTDTVLSSVTFSLANASRVLGAVENLTLSGTAGINATGNTLANVLVGNSGANVLDGGAGADTMRGGGGGDTYIVDNSNDTIDEAAVGSDGMDTVRSSVTFALATSFGDIENLTLTGSATIDATGNHLSNVLVGNNAANVLDGGAGADTMQGGGGNDTYIVDSAGDIVDESGSKGIDAVLSSVSFDLSNSAQAIGTIENLTLTGSGNTSATGNSVSNVLTGNTGDNLLDGGGGNDTLDGGAGNDTMRGGAGNDTYIVDSANDIVDESIANSTGTDTVQASVSFNLLTSARVLGVLESLSLTGSTDIDGTGNTANNVLTGNGGANVLDGGAGNDTLTGGLGTDTFRFSTALNAKTNNDVVTDFNVADDTIALDHTVFTALGGPGTLAAGAFHIGTAAADADDRIIYNTATGTLTYDTNGSAAGGAVQFANVGAGLALTNTDFMVA